MKKVWYFKKEGGQACGPLTQQELIRLANNGTIAATDIVWKEGTELRVLARNVGGLERIYNPQARSTVQYSQPVKKRQGPVSQAPVTKIKTNDRSIELPNINIGNILTEMKWAGIFVAGTFITSVVVNLIIQR